MKLNVPYAMTKDTALVKHVVRSGNALSVNVTNEAKRMGLKAGDDVLITLQRVDAVRENRFHGLDVIEAILDGHVMRSDDLNVRMAMDPMRLCTTKTPGTDCIAMAAIEPLDVVPKDVWTTSCPDILTFAFVTSWVIDDDSVSINEINRNTRAYNAILRDASKELGSGATPAEMNDMVRRLNDIGWDYDSIRDCGVYDHERL